MAKTKRKGNAEPVAHYSFTQMNMLLRCGEQYRRRYVEEERIPPSGALVRGKSAHKALETNFRQKMGTLKDITEEEMLSAYADAWEADKYNIAFTEEELGGRSPSVIAGKFKDSGTRMVRAYHREMSPKIMPVSVEQKFTVEFGEDVPPLVGVIDLEDVLDVVYDHKFSGKSPVQGAILSDVQMTTYDLGSRIHHRRVPSALRMVTTVDLKSGPKVVVQEAPPRDTDTITRFLHRMRVADLAVKAGNFLPAPNGAWWCSRKFCGYFDTCKVRP